MQDFGLSINLIPLCLLYKEKNTLKGDPILQESVRSFKVI